MPGGSRTGPMGMGSRTGRAAGYCAGYDAPGYANSGQRGGSGRAGGFGGRRGGRISFRGAGFFGRRRFGVGPGAPGPGVPYSNPNPELEKQALLSQVEALKAEMEYINKRLGELGME